MMSCEFITRDAGRTIANVSVIACVTFFMTFSFSLGARVRSFVHLFVFVVGGECGMFHRVSVERVPRFARAHNTISIIIGRE